MSTQNKISFYKSAKDRTPTESITITEFCKRVRDGFTADGVARVRAAASEDEKKAAKMTLPAVQLSGCVTEGLRAKAMEEKRFTHSGFLQLDVDRGGLNGKTPEEAKALLASDPHVLSAFISPSDAGAKALFKIRPCVDVDEHKSVFLAVEKYIAKTHGLSIDQSTKDSARLCYIPYDPDLTWRDTPIEFAAPAHESTPMPEVDSYQSKPDAFPLPPVENINLWVLDGVRWCNDNGMTESETRAKMQSCDDGSMRRHITPEELERALKKVFADTVIPDDIFPVPAGDVSYTVASNIIFSQLGKARRLFSRGGIPHEIMTSTTEPDYLKPITAERFCSLVEGSNRRIARRETVKGADGKNRIVWRKTGFPVSSAKILMETDAARNTLPAISQISASPILTRCGEILGNGYHEHFDGVLVTSKVIPVEMPIAAARTALLGLLDDFLFVSPSDKSRAVASLISPALKAGGHIADDFPIDVAEADQSQSGKTYRQKIVCRIYNEIPAAIIAPRGGVGSLDESIATALIKGRPFVALDNFRGRLDSTLLEEATRGHEVVTCRAPHTSGVEVRTRPFNFQLSTNGAEFTRDVSNRSIITRIKKQPSGYHFREFPEGDLETHILSKQAFYLGAVFSVIREWQRLGCPKTKDTRHAFRGWTQALDGIIQHVMELPPLLDGHRDQQDRVANPNLQWLRDIILAASPGDIGREMNTGQFLRIPEDAGIEFPGNPNSRDEPTVRAGRILGKLFRDSEGKPIVIDGFVFSRIEAPDYSTTADGGMRKFYTINRA